MEKVVIDPQGDVCFVTKNKEDHSKTGFVVSSVVVSLASKVFKALLGPSFAEGRALRQTPNGTPLDIQLPEDNPMGMRLMLEFLHFCSRPATLTFDELTELATVVDKYRCGDIFTAQATVWMRDLLEFEGFSKDLRHYLGASVAFRSAEIYTYVSIGIALTMDVSASWYPPKCDACLKRLVPGNVFDRIDEMCERFHTAITNATVKVLEPLNRKLRSDPTKFDHHRAVYCRHDESTIANFYRLLSQEGVLPYENEASPFTRLHKLCAVARALRIEDARFPPTSKINGCTACVLNRDWENAFRTIFDCLLDVTNPPCFKQDVLNSGKDLGKNDYCDRGCCDEKWNSPAITLLFGAVLGPRLLKESAQGYDFGRSIEERLGLIS